MYRTARHPRVFMYTSSNAYMFDTSVHAYIHLVEYYNVSKTNITILFFEPDHPELGISHTLIMDEMCSLFISCMYVYSPPQCVYFSIVLKPS